MRLVCPNCGAQYAVADDAIPASGRDVQCSNCSHTWFEAFNGTKAENQRPSAPRTPAAAEASNFDGAIADAFEDTSVDEQKLTPAPQAPANRKTVDPDVANILREEAEREAARRRVDTGASMEDQSDLGLRQTTETPKKAAAASAPVSQVAAAAASVRATMAQRPEPSRRDLLPDIEDVDPKIGKSKRPASRAIVTEEEEIKTRRGFRRGFFLILILFCIAAAVYVQADAIKQALPAASSALESYVSTVDAGRIWLDTTVRGFLTSMSDSSTTPPAE